MACLATTKHKPRPIDYLYRYAQGFRHGSLRHRIFLGTMRRAAKEGLLPDRAGEVLETVKREVRKSIYETPMQKCTRLDIEFENLQQGNLHHEEFLLVWKEMLADIADAAEHGYIFPETSTLFRKFLQKINPVHRQEVLARQWDIDLSLINISEPTRPY